MQLSLSWVAHMLVLIEKCVRKSQQVSQAVTLVEVRYILVIAFSVAAVLCVVFDVVYALKDELTIEWYLLKINLRSNKHLKAMMSKVFIRIWYQNDGILIYSCIQHNLQLQNSHSQIHDLQGNIYFRQQFSSTGYDGTIICLLENSINWNINFIKISPILN